VRDSSSTPPLAPTFIDLFAGCGGLSLGLCQAGWRGVFAVERATDAFKTFEANFLAEGSRFPFEWPEWLEKRAHAIDEVLDSHRAHLKAMRGTIDLIAGGPPCQGFSFAGRRNAADPRNQMFERYVTFVDLLRPKFLVLENVPGMDMVHVRRVEGKRSASRITYYERLVESLSALNYVVSSEVFDASRFGVPQRRARLVVVGIRGDVAKALPSGSTGVLRDIAAEGRLQLERFNPKGEVLSVEEAISDLAIGRGAVVTRNTAPYSDPESPRGFRQLKYIGPKTQFQRELNDGVVPKRMDSMRLPKHKDESTQRFELILSTCKRGVNISAADRKWLGMLKHRTVPMSRTLPAPTLTTLPDDILHYREPRILTVRECARIQSFPDWFSFKGKYTTGGARRRVECPRYTQVGNAVPPLLARAIGIGLLAASQESSGASHPQSPSMTVAGIYDA
jgi:DNA (cytosine-5)-methyltransferase 1